MAENWFTKPGFWEHFVSFSKENSKTQSSVNFLQSRPRKFTKPDFSGLARSGGVWVENSLSLTEFWGTLGEFCEKLGEFCEKLGEFVWQTNDRLKGTHWILLPGTQWALSELTELALWNRAPRNRVRPVSEICSDSNRFAAFEIARCKSQGQPPFESLLRLNYFPRHLRSRAHDIVCAMYSGFLVLCDCWTKQAATKDRSGTTSLWNDAGLLNHLFGAALSEEMCVVYAHARRKVPCRWKLLPWLGPPGLHN